MIVWISQLTVPFSSVPIRIVAEGSAARLREAIPDSIAAPPSRVILLLRWIILDSPPGPANLPCRRRAGQYTRSLRGFSPIAPSGLRQAGTSLR
ncbi:hypothetical protein D3C76_1577850 [compost metagenome]